MDGEQEAKESYQSNHPHYMGVSKLRLHFPITVSRGLIAVR